MPTRLSFHLASSCRGTSCRRAPGKNPRFPSLSCWRGPPHVTQSHTRRRVVEARCQSGCVATPGRPADDESGRSPVHGRQPDRPCTIKEESGSGRAELDLGDPLARSAQKGLHLECRHRTCTRASETVGYLW